MAVRLDTPAMDKMLHFPTNRRIKNALTPTNRDLLVQCRNAELTAAKRVKWEGREDVIIEWVKVMNLETSMWMNKDETYPKGRELVYILLNAALHIQECVTKKEKS